MKHPTAAQIRQALLEPNPSPPDSYEGGFSVECDGEIEGGVQVSSFSEDVFLCVSSCGGFASATTTVTLSDCQVDDLIVALGQARAARGVARRRRIEAAA